MSEVFKRLLKRIPSFKKRMTRISVDIGAQIFEYMKEAGINQRQLAEKLDKNESEISKWLNGSHNFTIETIAKIEDVFDKDIILVPLFAKEDLNIKYQVSSKGLISSSLPTKCKLWGLGPADLSINDLENSFQSNIGFQTFSSDSYQKTGT
ncbi:MAG: helix-turn-helix transcriptional regulator [Ignavibacteriae bacterium]|nr:helix-turn-helix transcriptional regulator [Ignavibacteriota bacterium]